MLPESPVDDGHAVDEVHPLRAAHRRGVVPRRKGREGGGRAPAAPRPARTTVSGQATSSRASWPVDDAMDCRGRADIPQGCAGRAREDTPSACKEVCRAQVHTATGPNEGEDMNWKALKFPDEGAKPPLSCLPRALQSMRDPRASGASGNYFVAWLPRQRPLIQGRRVVTTAESGPTHAAAGDLRVALTKHRTPSALLRQRQTQPRLRCPGW